MKSEWKSFCFECVPYRESGVSILAAVEDVQQMLDDHILKAQTMHRFVQRFQKLNLKKNDVCIFCYLCINLSYVLLFKAPRTSNHSKRR